MLHTLNRAWAKILARRVNERILFVYTTKEEQDMLEQVFEETYNEIGDACYMWVASVKDIKEEMEYCKLYGREFRMCDDILISSNINDIMLKDVLCRHCKRKSC